MQQCKPILLVEDDNIDVMVFKRLLSDMKVLNPLVELNDGEKALEYLRSEGNERPCMILLDLNMPKMTGIEFLKTAKGEYILKKIPVIMLTTSKDDQDVVESFKLGAGGYVVKPVDIEKFLNATRLINLHWALIEPQNEV